MNVFPWKSIIVHIIISSTVDFSKGVAGCKSSSSFVVQKHSFWQKPIAASSTSMMVVMHVCFVINTQFASPCDFQENWSNIDDGNNLQTFILVAGLFTHSEQKLQLFNEQNGPSQTTVFHLFVFLQVYLNSTKNFPHHGKNEDKLERSMELVDKTQLAPFKFHVHQAQALEQQ